MFGLESLLHHLVTLFLVWLIMIFAIRFAKRIALREAGGIFSDKDSNWKNQKIITINRIAVFVYNIVTSIVIIMGIVIAFFLWNPMERDYEEMDKITPATEDRNIKKFTKEEIFKSNKEVINRKSTEKEMEAEADNKKAMEEASEVFKMDK